MTPRLDAIWRHPIKSHGREALASVVLCAGQGVPGDRRWAVAHDAARLVPGWNPCVNFARGAKAPGLMAINARSDGDHVTLSHPDRADLTFAPDDAADLPRFLAWVAGLNPAERAQPAAIVAAGRAMTDTDFPSVSLLNLASNADLGARMGLDLSPLRWRANLWLDDLPAWAERGWIGRHIRIGGALLHVQEQIVRCSATTVNPATGRSDADTLAALKSGFGHQEFGIYATVVESGPITPGDKVVLQ